MKSCLNHINENTCNSSAVYIYNVNVCKINYINSISGSMRLVRQGDKLNKETIIYIPYTLLHHQLGVYNQNC